MKKNDEQNIKEFKYIILSCICIGIAIICIVIFKNNRKEINDDSIEIDTIIEKNDSVNEDETSYLEKAGIHKTYIDRKKFPLNGVVLCELAKKNGDWSNLPLSKNFIKKYNEKDGILKEIEFDSIVYRPYDKEIFPYNNNYYYFEISQGKKKTVYVCEIIWEQAYANGGYFETSIIDDVVFLKIFNTTDENGNKIEVGGFTIYDIDKKKFLAKYLYGYEYELAITNDYKKKFPNFLDLFIHYSDYYGALIDYDKSNLNDNKLYVTVEGSLEKIMRNYIVVFKFDDKGYLDDATVKCIGEYKYTGSFGYGPTCNEMYLAMFYNHTDKDYLISAWGSFMTDEFKDRIKNSDATSIFPDIDKIGRNYDKGDAKSVFIDGLEHTIMQYVFEDGSLNYYVKFINRVEGGSTTMGLFDDISFEHLPYQNLSMEEVEKKYLEEKPYIRFVDKYKGYKSFANK